MSAARRLLENERQSILDKIEKIYRNSARRFGTRVFDIQHFYERYNQSLLESRDEDSFLLAEIHAIAEFEKKQLASSQIVGPIIKESVVIQSIYDAYLEKLSSYPRIHLTDNAEAEMEFLLGCLKEISFHRCASVRIYLKENYNSLLDTEWAKFETELSSLAGTSALDVSVEFEKYVGRIKGLSSRDAIQKEGHSLLKRCFSCINTFKSFVSRVTTENPNAIFSNQGHHLTAGEFNTEIKKYISKIYSDFRLKAFENESFI